jgi:DNA-binding PadR family transcriptional regulator
MASVFAHGALRLYLLALLESGPKHGYELIKALSERFGGTYSPSAGTIYPRLGKLEEEGLVSTRTEGRRTNYSITAAGLKELNSRRDELAGVEDDISASVRRLADTLRQDIRANMRGLRADLAATAEAARSTVRSAGWATGPAAGAAKGAAAGADAGAAAGSAAAPRYSPEGEARLREAEMLVQAFRDDIRIELRRHAGRRPVSPVTLETVKTVLDQARIAIRNSLDD